jgi:1-aminocyclopropane-1-carboxylate deaminase/D-cysteine desulfhydrase-like pyridoxal-dependent ACC family enzyme
MALAHGALSEKGEQKKMPRVHAIAVCDDEDYFYKFMAGIVDEVGLTLPPGTSKTEHFIRQHVAVYQGKGLGYAVSTPEELEMVSSFARDTGIVLDPVYSGKALCKFFEVIKEDPDSFRGKNILFWHTGGALGLFDKTNDLLPTLQTQAPCKRLDVYGNGIGVDLSTPAEDK